MVIHQPRPDPSFLDVLEVLSSLQAWLATVSRRQLAELAAAPGSSSSSKELHCLALSAMERVACASGLLSAVLRFAFAMLEEAAPPLPAPEKEGEEEEEEGVDPVLVAATQHLLECVEEEERNAKGKLAQVRFSCVCVRASAWVRGVSRAGRLLAHFTHLHTAQPINQFPTPQAVASPLAPVLSAAFDPYEMSASGIVISEDGAHVRCHTASHSHAYLNVGFKEGR